MILQALYEYYLDLLKNGEIEPDGWSKEKVSYAVLLDNDGKMTDLLDLRETVRVKSEKDTEKYKKIPRRESVPERPSRTSGVRPFYLCDNSKYILGIGDEKSSGRVAECFKASKELHQDRLKNVDSPAARAIVQFFDTWQPDKAKDDPIIQEKWNDLVKGANLVFYHNFKPVLKDEKICKDWQDAVNSAGQNTEGRLCLVSGQIAPVALSHPQIKGVAGVTSGEASLVSFNQESFCSYGGTTALQGANAPISKQVALGYTKALNSLLSNPDGFCRLGETTIVYWAKGGNKAYQEAASTMLDAEQEATDDNSSQESKLDNIMKKMSAGLELDWKKTTLNPDTEFYVLGLAPNAGRISVDFFWHNKFGKLLENVKEHYDRLEIVRAKQDPILHLSPKWLIAQTLRITLPGTTPDKPSKRLPRDLMFSILNNAPYPATLLNGVVIRMRAEQGVRRGQAAILKAYYLKKSRDERFREVLTVELNKDTTYMPYVLGRLFAVLERLQKDAQGDINTTIRDRYFNAACATPKSVFSHLMRLSNYHKDKLEPAARIFYEKQITDLVGRITETPPARFNLDEQSAFQLGYYHQVRDFYTKKETKEDDNNG